MFQIVKKSFFFCSNRANQDPLVEFKERLFIGCYPSVCSLKKLKEQKVSHVLNCCKSFCKSPFQSDGIVMNNFLLFYKIKINNIFYIFF